MRRTKQLQGLRKFEDGRAHRGVRPRRYWAFRSAPSGVSDSLASAASVASSAASCGVKFALLSTRADAFGHRAGLVPRDGEAMTSGRPTSPGSGSHVAPGYAPATFRSWILSLHLKFAVYV